LPDRFAGGRRPADILVANAGISKAATIEETTVEDFDKLFAGQFRAPFFLVQQLLPILAQAPASSWSRRSYAHAAVGTLPPMRQRTRRERMLQVSIASSCPCVRIGGKRSTAAWSYERRDQDDAGACAEDRQQLLTRKTARDIDREELVESSTVVSSSSAAFEMPALRRECPAVADHPPRTCLASLCAPSGAERSAHGVGAAAALRISATTASASSLRDRNEPHMRAAAARPARCAANAARGSRHERGLS